MHRSASSPDSHLRSLIDQRSARAEFHGRYSPFSADSDTPSVYSRPYFSPKPSKNGDHSPYQSDYDYPSPAPSSNSAHFNRLHDPTTSILDLDDDPRTSFATSDSYEDDEEERTYEDAEDTQPMSRMSYLGPKMRFHSRAPWELDDGALEEEEEPEESPRHFPPGFPFPRENGAKSTMSESSSLRPSCTSRPSVDSSRSQVPPKRSFETINSQISHSRGALYTAQESLSSHSLAQAQQRKASRNKFSLGSNSPSVSIPTSPCPSQTRTPVLGRLPSPPKVYDQPTQSFEEPTSSSKTAPYKKGPASSGDAIHPYANPDLVVSYTESPNSPSRSTLSLQPPPRNDSCITVTESYTLNSLSRTGTRAALASDSSMNSVVSKTRASSVHLKNISSPISVIPPSQRPDFPIPDCPDINLIPHGVNNLPGWMDRNATPAFTLISLEEARAQRMRSTTANDASRISSAIPTSSTSSPDDAESSTSTHRNDTSPYGSSTSRARGRSISAGAKAKNALQSIVGQPKPERRDSEPSIFVQQSNNGSKTLKHKKSGFMRLFNGAKLQEKEERVNPPPVPFLPDGHSFNNGPPQRTPLPPVHRIPVPSISPSLLDASSTLISNSVSDGGTRKPDFQNPRRSLPYLSINTGHQAPSPRLPPPETSDRSTATHTMPPSTGERPWQHDQQPQSAPANASDFPTLRLRPVSALFSAHFGDHIVTTEPRSSAETDPDTQRSSSPSGLISPVTPGSYPRSSNDLPFALIHDEQSSIVKNLEQQMDSSRKAWQKHIRELEGQVRTLKAELEELRAKDYAHYCDACGRGKVKEYLSTPPASGGIVNRPRARTGASSRFTSALP